MFRSNEIVFLIGAGCSVEAHVPAAEAMIKRLEDRLTRPDWQKFADLYSYLKGTIVQASYIEGRNRFNHYPTNPDIERLVVVLAELEKHNKSVLYPFIGSWAPHLVHVTKNNFELIKEFKTAIIDQLKDWVKPSDQYRASAYYQGFFRFQQEYNYPLRVFSLNYDLCFESNIPSGTTLELGFSGDPALWDGYVFAARDEDEVQIYLYKLHGSMDWERDEKQGTLKRVTFPADQPDLIFGTEFKMQYVDPYLFYAHEFRRYTREAKLIVTVGYSFRDPHINGMIRQALQQRAEAILLVLYHQHEIVEAQDLGQHFQVKQLRKDAREFLETLSVENLQQWSGVDGGTKKDDVPF